MSKSKQPPRRRLNTRALMGLVAAVVVVGAALFGLRALQDQRGKTAFLREAKTRLEKGEARTALGYVDRYLELNPSNPEGLALKSRALFETASTIPELIEAAQAQVKVIGLLGGDPPPEERIEARRRLVELSLKIPGRGQSAESHARELVADLEKKGGPAAVDAKSRRLLASAIEEAALLASSEAKVASLIAEAKREFQAAERLDPGDIDGAIRIASFYHDRMKDDASALEVLNRTVEATAGKPERHAEALLARAQFAIETDGDLDKAREDIAGATRDDPKNVKAPMTAARLAFREKDYEGARKHLQRVPKEGRTGLNFRLLEGSIEFGGGRPDEAIRSWRAGLVESGGNDPELTWRLAQILIEIGRTEDAKPLINQYRRLVGGEPNSRYYYLLGLIALKANQPAKAVEELEKSAYKVDAGLEGQVQFSLGQAYQAKRDVPKATAAYRLAVDRSRDWALPWLALAALELATNPDKDKGIETLRRGQALMPKDAKLLGALARALWTKELMSPTADRRWNEVERLLAEADKEAPGDPDVALIRAEYLAATGRPLEAIGLLEAAVKLHPEAAELWLALANASFRKSELGEALKRLDEGQAAAGPQAGFFITRASVYVMKGDITKARDALVDGISQAPVAQRGLLWKSLGDLYQARGDLPSARAAFEKWAEIQPENPDPRIALVLLAIDAKDEPGIAKAIEAVGKVAGPRGYYLNYVRVEDLLRDRPGENDPDAVARRQEEAKGLIAEILGPDGDSQLPLGHLLRGRLLEAKGDAGGAIASYREAIKLGGGAAALNPLLALLAKESSGDGTEGARKYEQSLEEIRDEYPGGTVEFDRLAAVQSMRMGNRDQAQRLAALAVQGDPNGLDVQIWQAEVLKLLGKPTEALATLNALVEKKPAETTPWLQLLMLKVSQGDRAGALATIERMKSRAKTTYPELLWAQCYRAAGDLGKATESYAAALRRWPDDPRVLMSAVGFYQQTGQAGRAEQVLRSILKSAPENATARRRLAEALAARSGDRDAWAEAAALVGPVPRPDDVPDDTLTRAKVYAAGPAAEDRQKAAAILEELLVQLPTLDAARELLAKILLAEGRRGDAKAQIARVTDGPRPTPDALLFHAALLLEEKDLDGAEKITDRLAKVAPDSLPVAEIRSRILAERGKPAEAAAPLEEAFASLSKSPDALGRGTQITRALLAVKRPDAAERVARTLAELGPKGRCLLAELVANLGRPDEAVAELATAAKADLEAAGSTALTLATTDPEGAPRWLGLADEYLGQAAKSGAPSVPLLEKIALLRHFQKRHDDEISTYETMLAQGPANFLFLNNMAWTLAVDMNQPEKAIEWADKALEKAGRRPEILDTRGVILTRLGKHDEAIQDLLAAAKESPSPSFFFHLALAYQKKGDLDQARAYRDKAEKAGLKPDRLQGPERDEWDAIKAL